LFSNAYHHGQLRKTPRFDKPLPTIFSQYPVEKLFSTTDKLYFKA